ncbi:MAG TPA: patatin-like phospholipase family protein [Acidimicrobiales bacterium]|nr:patatin-like phospholipase family protein [Acidimicrobiales bacterium]
MSRALVLGGGGPVGIGWESGLVAGLRREGVDLGEADAVIGTSAGSFVGALLTSGLDPGETVRELSGVRPDLTAPSRDGTTMAERMQRLMDAIMRLATSGMDEDEGRREIGRLALEAPGIPEEAFLAFFSVLRGLEWPDRFACTAVDAESGQFVVWRKGGEADLQHGVASSCAVPAVYSPVTIGGRRYVDGGMRDALNADVASGHDRVLLVSVMALALPEGMSNPMFDALVGRTHAAIDGLRAEGAQVAVIEPDAELLDLSGGGTALMDAGRAEAAYEAGMRLASAEAPRIAELWN